MRFAVVTLSVCAGVHAQCPPRWTDRSGASEPGPRHGAAAAYDGIGIMMFGGDAPSAGRRDETWLRRAGVWHLANPAVRPSRRYQHSMAYDSSRNRVVLFGGYGPTTPILGDTWEWDGSIWQQRLPAANPHTRYSAAMAYDPVRDRVVLFGGEEPFTAGLFNDTWEWDGVNWAERNLAARPSQRYGHAMAFDNSREKMVLFGGAGGGSSGEETWELDNAGWVRRFPSNFPTWRYGHRMFYDVPRSRTVLFGGFSSSGVNAQTWEWDGTNWALVVTDASPSARFFYAMAFEPTNANAMVFGGTPDFSSHLAGTWEFSSLSRADFDRDGFVTGADFDAYVAAFESGDGRADFDGDTFITGTDFDQYVGAFEAGC